MPAFSEGVIVKKKQQIIMDQEEIEREIKSLRKMSINFVEFMLNRVEVDRLEKAFDEGQMKIKQSQNNVLNEHAAQLDKLTRGLELMNEVVQRQHAANVALCAILEEKGVNVSHLKIVL